MTTPELPPPNAYFWTPKPESGLRPELKSWSTNCGPHPKWDVVGYYTTEEVAAAVLAERERCAKLLDRTGNDHCAAAIRAEPIEEPRCDECQYCWPHEEFDGENYVWATHCNLALPGGKTIVKEEGESHPAWCPLLAGNSIANQRETK